MSGKTYTPVWDLIRTILVSIAVPTFFPLKHRNPELREPQALWMDCRTLPRTTIQQCSFLVLSKALFVWPLKNISTLFLTCFLTDGPSIQSCQRYPVGKSWLLLFSLTAETTPTSLGSCYKDGDHSQQRLVFRCHPGKQNNNSRFFDPFWCSTL
jgi:hypothetical protein